MGSKESDCGHKIVPTLMNFVLLPFIHFGISDQVTVLNY